MPKTLLFNNLKQHIDEDISRLPAVIRQLCSEKKLQQALLLVSLALEKHPDSPDLLNIKGELKFASGDKSEAKLIFHNIINHWPSHAKALSNLATIFWLEGDVQTAVNHFTKSLQVNRYDRDTIYNYYEVLSKLKQAQEIKPIIEDYLNHFPEDRELRHLLMEIKNSTSIDKQKVQLLFKSSPVCKDTTKIVMTSGRLQRYNGGTKIYNLWTELLRKHGFDAFIATQDGTFDNWLVNHQPVIGYIDVENMKQQGNDVHVLSSWLDTGGLEKLIGDSQFYYFDAELRWTLQFRDKLDYFLNNKKIAKIATHSRYIQSWYMANYGIKPTLINEWSDQKVFYEDSSKRIPLRVGCMPESNAEDEKTFDFLKDKCIDFGNAEIIKISGDEKNVSDLLRTTDIFAGLNPGKHPFWGEGCPRTQQEALHCGCVLVAYDCLGNREYLYNNWTGLMVPSSDMQALWQGIKFLLENPQEKERIRANSKNIAENLFSERNKYELVNLFLDLNDNAEIGQADFITKDQLASILLRPFWLNEQEVPFLAQQTTKAKNTIVEIGCAYGGSTTVFLLNKRDGVQVYSIDPFVQDSKGESLHASEQDCRFAVEQALISKSKNESIRNWYLINGYSHDVVKSWDKQIDLLFIDGSHHYEDVKRDFEQWSGFVAPDGKILIHDSRKDNFEVDPFDQKFSRGWAGPTKLAEELRSSKEFKNIGHCYSITVLERI